MSTILEISRPAQKRPWLLTTSLVPVAVAAAACALPSVAAAQATPPAAREQVLREAPPIDLSDETSPACAQPPERPEPGNPGPILRSIDVPAGLGVSKNRLDAEWGPLIGTPVDQPKLDRLAGRLVCVWREAGYPLVKLQILPTGDGNYRLEIEEGRVSRVEIQGGSAAEQDFVRRAFGGIGPDRVFDRAALHRGLAIARGYGVWGVRPALAGDVLVLTIQPARPWLYLSAQNLSGETVGRWSVGATVGVHGLTPLYENTQLGVFHGLFDDRQRGVQLSSDALLTKDGLGVHGDVSWFQEKPDEQAPNPDTIGTTKVARIELDHPIKAGPRSLSRWRVGLEAIDQDTKLAVGGAATLKDRVRVAYAGVDAEGVGRHTRWRVDLQARQGLDGLGASREGDPLLSRPDANPQGFSIRGSAQLNRMLEKGELELRVRGQWSGDSLPAFEEFTYGGFAGGRGLDPSAMQGDSGVAVTLEYRRQGPNILGGTLAGFGFVEGAAAWNNDAFGPDEADALLVGAGLRLSYPNRLNVEAAFSTPVETHNVPDALEGPRFTVVVTKGFGG